MLSAVLLSPNADAQSIRTHDDLVEFFFDWRAFHAPPNTNGVPDYSPEAMHRRHAELARWQERLAAADTSGWTIAEQIDWYIVRAEMNGLDFAHRVKKPWSRDPAFWVWFYPNPTDVPEREGPQIWGAVELPDYGEPLTSDDAEEIARRLRRMPAVYEHARTVLTGNARDLWVTGVRSIQAQSEALDIFARRMESDFPDLSAAAREARTASDGLASWLAERSDEKTGTSGVGKDNYSWNLRHVHLLPYDWEDEVLLMQRELNRSHASLRLEEHRNRDLPGHAQIQTPDEYDRRLNEAVDEYMAFLEEEAILPIREYMDQALRERIGSFSPVEEGELRGFFSEITYRDPIVMRTHHYHWFDLARMRDEPHESPIRATPLLYNMFDGRAEGMATGMEEMMMHAGLLDEKPRARELIWVLLAQRAARGLGGLYQHGLEMSFDEATQYASKWTPWGLLPADGATIQWEEQFYLRQPAYGTSYVIGKLEIERLIAEYARQREGSFDLGAFMDAFNASGVIPVSLIHWEMTGDKSVLLDALGEE
ncbi:MAG: DUF885 family protein [Gemmatimonadetes bacterium]|nr:DUF885 family protein [Gemmatimonadota bacterium]